MHLNIGAGTAIIDVVGELDLDTAGEAQRLLDLALAAEPRLLVFDLREMTFLDSAGLTLFVRANRRMRNIDGTVAVANASPRVVAMLERLGLDVAIRVHPSPVEPAELLAMREGAHA